MAVSIRWHSPLLEPNLSDMDAQLGRAVPAGMGDPFRSSPKLGLHGAHIRFVALRSYGGRLAVRDCAELPARRRRTATRWRWRKERGTTMRSRTGVRIRAASRNCHDGRGASMRQQWRAQGGSTERAHLPRNSLLRVHRRSQAQRDHEHDRKPRKHKPTVGNASRCGDHVQGDHVPTRCL